jgi:A/G-specific adenine glycosylase
LSRARSIAADTGGGTGAVPHDEPIAPRLLAWFERHGRHGLPWQVDRTPYSVWVSEVMLQQTQVSTVIAFYERFMRRFPTVDALSAAPLDDVLSHWSGLGYYARARNLWNAARAIAADHGGRVPESYEQLLALPGIGRSTAGAILAQARGARHAILDGNVKRVLARYHAVEGWPGENGVQRQLWEYAERHTPHERVAEYTQAIMDLGATVCTRSSPRCAACPVAGDCAARRLGLTASLPTKRARPARPSRSLTVLVVQSGEGATLLERRPTTGIWGGLLSFPELGEGQSPADWCRSRLGTEPAAEEPLAEVDHAFTHFDLKLKPLRLVLASGDGSVMDDSRWLWYKAADPLPGGIAAPISRILAGVTQSESSS